MCGIAGLIHRGKSSDVGSEMTSMLQSLKHRGPDSTGFALYGNPEKKIKYARLIDHDPVSHGTCEAREENNVMAWAGCIAGEAETHTYM